MGSYLAKLKTSGRSTANSSGLDFPIDEVPDEILIKILSFIPGKQLVKSCTLVCHKWRDIIDGPTLWRQKLEHERIHFPKPGLITNLDFKRIFIKEPFNRNLLVNHNATDGFNGWTVLFNGGDQWAVEDVESLNMMESADNQNGMNLEGVKCWVTSFDWCFKQQTVDLLKNEVPAEFLDKFQPPITVSVWTSARRDAGSVYNLEVSLLERDVCDSSQRHPHDMFRLPKVHDEPHEEVTPRTYKFSKRVEQWQGGMWHYVSHTFTNYGPGIRFVKFLDGGKDTMFWAGRYGSKMAFPHVDVGIPPELQN